MQLWRVIGENVPVFCFFLCETADEAVQTFLLGIEETSDFEDIQAIPLTLEQIADYLSKEGDTIIAGGMVTPEVEF